MFGYYHGGWTGVELLDVGQGNTVYCDQNEQRCVQKYLEDLAATDQ